MSWSEIRCDQCGRLASVSESVVIQLPDSRRELIVPYYDGDNYMDGPALVRWLEDRYPDFRAVCGENFSRRAVAWRSGRRATVPAVDIGLCRLGVHFTDLPDHVWQVDQSFDRGAGKRTRFKVPA